MSKEQFNQAFENYYLISLADFDDEISDDDKKTAINARLVAINDCLKKINSGDYTSLPELTDQNTINGIEAGIYFNTQIKAVLEHQNPQNSTKEFIKSEQALLQLAADAIAGGGTGESGSVASAKANETTYNIETKGGWKGNNLPYGLLGFDRFNSNEFQITKDEIVKKLKAKLTQWRQGLEISYLRYNLTDDALKKFFEWFDENFNALANGNTEKINEFQTKFENIKGKNIELPKSKGTTETKTVEVFFNDKFPQLLKKKETKTKASLGKTAEDSDLSSLIDQQVDQYREIYEDKVKIELGYQNFDCTTQKEIKEDLERLDEIYDQIKKHYKKPKDGEKKLSSDLLNDAYQGDELLNPKDFLKKIEFLLKQEKFAETKKKTQAKTVATFIEDAETAYFTALIQLNSRNDLEEISDTELNDISQKYRKFNQAISKAEWPLLAKNQHLTSKRLANSARSCSLQRSNSRKNSSSRCHV